MDAIPTNFTESVHMHMHMHMHMYRHLESTNL